ncbi:hypothetical protein SprV_0200926700 [Sparganum proliferum]
MSPRVPAEKKVKSDTLKTSLKRLQIIPVNWEDLARDQPTWRLAQQSTKPTASPPPKPNATLSNLDCPYLATPALNRLRPAHGVSGRSGHPSVLLVISEPSAARGRHQLISLRPCPPMSTIDPIRAPDLPLPSLTASTIAAAAPAPTTTATIPDAPSDVDFATANTNDLGSALTCPHCERTFTSHTGLVGHLRIHRAETGERVLETPTHTRRISLHCVHCHRTFTRRMNLFGHIRIHDSGIRRSLETPSTSCAPDVPSPTHTPSHACPPPPPPSSKQTLTLSVYPAQTVVAHSPHPSVWPVTCESIAQKLPNQRLEYQPTLVFASTALTAPPHSLTTRTYKVTRKFMKTCGRQLKLQPPSFTCTCTTQKRLPSPHNAGTQSPPPTLV